MKKILALVLLLACLVACPACGDAERRALNAQLIITGPQGEILSAAADMANGDTAADLIDELCAAQRVEFSCSAGMYDNFGGYPSQEQEGWLLYVNNELADVGAKDVALDDGMLVEFRYANYGKAFAEFSE